MKISIEKQIQKDKYHDYTLSPIQKLKS